MAARKKPGLSSVVLKFIETECRSALAETGAQVPVMKLSEISDVAEAAYQEQPEGTMRDARLRAARSAADAKVAELRVDKLRGPLDTWSVFAPMPGNLALCAHCKRAPEAHDNGRCPSDN